MQLFTIGLYTLNLDGSRQLDGQGNRSARMTRRQCNRLRWR